MFFGKSRCIVFCICLLLGFFHPESSHSIILILQEGMAYELIVGTTKIVSGHTLTESFVEKLG